MLCVTESEIDVHRAKKVDERVASEIKATFAHGVQPNRQNSLFHRTARQVSRNDSAIRKTHTNNECNQLREQIQELKASRKQSIQQQKELEAQLEHLKGSETQTRQRRELRPDRATSSSSSRVTSQKPPDDVAISGKQSSLSCDKIYRSFSSRREH